MKNSIKLLKIIACCILHSAPIDPLNTGSAIHAEIFSPCQTKILKMWTNDKKVINIEFNERKIHAQSDDSRYVFSTSNGLLSIPINYSPTRVNINSFCIFKDTDNGFKYLGDLEFYCVSHEFQLHFWNSNNPNYICLKRCTFELPNAADTFSSEPRPYVSASDKIQLWNEMISYRPDAVQVFSSGYSMKDIEERFSLITQFIWSLDPLVNSSGSQNHLGLMDKIRELREHKFGLLCQGFRDLFVEIASVLMPDVAVRYVDGYEFYYPKCKNITVNSHAFLEVSCEGKWWVIDPTFRFYLLSASGEPIDANCVRNLRESHQIEKVNVVHIPTIKPQYKSFRFDEPEWSHDIFNRNYWCFFRWLNYRSIQ